jgi:hypothetical protein
MAFPYKNERSFYSTRKRCAAVGCGFAQSQIIFALALASGKIRL